MDMRLTEASVLASIIIPTYNRSASLQKTLEALAVQNSNPGRFEIIVVSDGCTDNTAGVVKGFSGSPLVRYFEQVNSGAASARNHGADQARGKLLIFLDDDAEAQPQFLEAHVRAHDQNPNLVLMGYLPPILELQKGFFREEILDWWEAVYQPMRQPGYRFAYSDLISGNFSIPSSLFREIGGFNPQLRCREDYELGARLLARGADFAFSDQAAALHHEKSDLSRSLRRKFDEGIADVQIGRIHPSLLASMLMSRLERYSLLPSRVLRALAFRFPYGSERLAAFLQSFLSILERVKAYRHWQRLLYGLMGYWYWRGVAKELGSRRELKKFLTPGLHPMEDQGYSVEIDLSQGIPEAEKLLDTLRPDGARLFYHSHPVGTIPPLPGREKLRGDHLRSLLAKDFMVPMARALVLEGSVDMPPSSREGFIARCDEVIQKRRLFQSPGE